MAKRSNRNSPDILSETQSNVRWFYGSRSRTSWMDMTGAEWSQYLRGLQSRRRSDLIFAIIIIIVGGIPLLIGAIAVFRNTGFSYPALATAGITILFWAWIILYLKSFFRKD